MEQNTKITDTPIAKAVAGTALAISGLFVGQTLDNQKIADIQAEKQAIIQKRDDLSGLYLYSQARLGDNRIDGSVLPLNDVATVYQKFLDDNNVKLDISKPIDLFQEVRKEAERKGDYTCKP